MEKLILWKTLIIYAIVFVFSALLALLVQSLKPKSERRMNIWIRIVSWVCIIPIFIIPAYFGGVAFSLLIALLAMLGIREYLDVTKIKGNNIFCGLVYILGLSFIICAFLNLKEIFYSLPALTILIMLMAPVFIERYQNSLYLSAVSLLGVLYVGGMLSYLIMIRSFFGGFGYIIFLGTMAAAQDNIAYAVGKIFGKDKKKLIPNISPNKTVIGSIGGLIGTILASWLFRFTVPNLSLNQCLFLGFLLGVTGQLGDLVISVIKRDMGIKDMGNLIRGHGGVLDRFDSWVFSAPFVYYYLKFFIR